MRRGRLALLTSVVALAVIAAACSSGNSGNGSGSFQGAALTGAGSTFVQPVYQKWFHDFQGVELGAQINYQAIGSGGGITDLQQKTVDFADSDAPLQASDMSGFNGASVVERIDQRSLGAIFLATTRAYKKGVNRWSRSGGCWRHLSEADVRAYWSWH